MGDCVGAATGQVNADDFVYTGCADDCVEMTGDGVAIAGEADSLGWSVRVGSVLVTTGSALVLHLAAGEGDCAASGVRDAPGALPVLPAPLGAGLADDRPVPPSADRVPLPSVPAMV